MPDGSLMPRWLDRAAAATYLSMKPSKLMRLAKQGRLPAPSYVTGPKSPMWDRQALDEFLSGGVASGAKEVPFSDVVADACQKIIQRGSRRARRAQGPG